MQVQEAQRIPNKMNTKRTTPRHIIIKMPKIKDKENLKSNKRKVELPAKEFPSDYLQISQKKPCRQEGAGKKYSKS